MSDWWPWKRRKVRSDRGWQKVEEAAAAAQAEKEAVLQLAEQRADSGMDRRDAYASVLREFMERKRGSNG